MNILLKKKKGFTLIELVVVIAILVILISIAIPKYMKSNLSAQAAAHNANVRVLKNAAILYLTDNPEVGDGEIASSLITPYLEGKIPAPAKGLSSNSFKVTNTGGDVKVEPGIVKVDGKQLVLDTE